MEMSKTKPKAVDADDCSCLKIIGHLESVKWLLYPRLYRPSPGYLALGDWKENAFIWLHFIPKSDGKLIKDDVLLSKETRYWDTNDVQRYFLGNLHCEQVLFTCQYPNLKMKTPFGSHLWKSNTALKLPPAPYQKELRCALERTLKSMITMEVQLDRLIISDQLIMIEKLDYFKRKTFFRLLNDILSFQDSLQLVSLENLGCKRLEGVRLIQQLSCFNAHSLKYLFLWRFVLPNENPLLINYSYITGSGEFIERPDLRQTFLRSLGALRSLRVLAIEYAHLADGTGGALLSLLPVIKVPYFRLQLMCREDQTPGLVDAALGVGGYDIPDSAWRRVTIACPDLYLFMAFFRVRDYDKIRRFLTPSMPLHEVHLQLGIDLKMRQRQDSDLSCFFRHIAYQYSSTLVTVTIHQWRAAVFPLRRVFEILPRLSQFMYIGRVQDETDLRNMLMIVACGVCSRLKLLKILIQDDEEKQNYWSKVTKALTEEFLDIMELYKIAFCLHIYKQ